MSAAPPQPGTEPYPAAELPALVESLLFIAREPASPQELGQALRCAPAAVKAALEALDASLRRGRRGLRLQRTGRKYALVTLPAAAAAVARFTALATRTRLSKPALETLAIIAYQQPVTRGQLEGLRGVDCAHILRSLLGREFIEVTGRRATVGHPRLYGVTEAFLQYFGLASLAELPALSDQDASRIAAALAEETLAAK